MEDLKTNGEKNRFTKRIGTTEYVVNVYFSETEHFTLEDRLLHLIRNDLRGNALSDRLK